MKRLIAQVLFFVIAASLLGIARNAVAPNGVGWVGDWAQRDSVVAAVANNPNMLPPSAQDDDPPMLTLEKAVQLQGQPNVVFIDARAPEEYQAGHIPGAVNLPFDYFDTYYPIVEQKVAKDKHVVTYCSGAECELSLFLAREMRRLGYTDISIFYGGWGMWTDNGKPVETSDSTATSAS